jgi:hypothetical protein
VFRALRVSGRKTHIPEKAGERGKPVQPPFALCGESVYDEGKTRKGGVIRMGVKFSRVYGEIIDDMVPAIASIENWHLFLGMSHEDWMRMEDREKLDCIRTLADDLLYCLGTERRVDVGSGTVEYDAGKHLIKVKPDGPVVHVIHLM